MRHLLLFALPLLIAAAGCRHPDPPPPQAPPPGDGLAELVWTFEPGPDDAGIPKTRATLRYDGTGTLDTGEGPVEFTLGPMGMATLVEAIERAKAFAGESFGDPECKGGCTHQRVEVKATRGAVWTLTAHGSGAPTAVEEVFFSLLQGVRPN